MDLTSLYETVLDDRIKGIPGGTDPFPLSAIGAKGWNVLRQDLPLPVMVLKESALTHNLTEMRRFTEDHGVSLAPHGKTSMAPQLFRRQLQCGAWGITCATVNQMQVYRRYGVPRILMANQVVGRQNLRYVVEQLNGDPDFDFYCLVDSSAAIRQMADYAREYGLQRPIQVLLEVGFKGGRTGCRTMLAVDDVVSEVASAGDVIVLSGVEGFEGIIDTADGTDLSFVNTFLETILEHLSKLSSVDFGNREEIVISAGGSFYFDRVTEILNRAEFPLPVRTVIRSGCYLTHDSRSCETFHARAIERGLPMRLRAALEVWSYVQSIPEPDLALLTMGKRDCPFDAGHAVPLKRRRPGDGAAPLSQCEIFELHDQHGFMRIGKGDDLQVGDMVASGISHPCTAFDKWQFIPVVDDEYNVTDGILTFF